MTVQAGKQPEAAPVEQHAAAHATDKLMVVHQLAKVMERQILPLRLVHLAHAAVQLQAAVREAAEDIAVARALLPRPLTHLHAYARRQEQVGLEAHVAGKRRHGVIKPAKVLAVHQLVAAGVVAATARDTLPRSVPTMFAVMLTWRRML